MKRHHERRGLFIRNVLGVEPLPSTPLVEVVDNRRALIENHQGILAYGSNEICVKVRNGSIKVEGNHLELMCISKEKVVICGQIDGIRLCRGGK